MFIHSKPFCKQTEINDIDDIQHVSSTYCYLWICAFIFGVRSMFHSGLINDFDKKNVQVWQHSIGHMSISHFSLCSHMAVCQNLVPLVSPKIAGKWMFIPQKMVLIGIDP